jgi:Protein of unknown function (DUF3617)
MRKLILACVLCLGAGLLWAGSGKYQPLNVKTGLWETTVTTSMSGHMPIPPETLAKLTPEQRARFEAAMKSMAKAKSNTNKSCLTKEKLEKDPFNREDKACTETVLASTGSQMEVREVCTRENSKADITVHLVASDSEHVTGTIKTNVSGGGNTMTADGKMTSKWLGPACGNVK